MEPIIDPKSWREAYQAALDERDPVKLEERVRWAEGALFFRWQQLSNSEDHYNERLDMNLAIAELLRLKTEGLGWPPIQSPETNSE